jgi:signal transduction histidine kinase
MNRIFSGLLPYLIFRTLEEKTCRSNGMQNRRQRYDRLNHRSRLRCGCRPDRDGHLALSVQDTGIGIASEALPNVGRPFWQADGALSRRHEGVGLGLALTKRLLQLHDGALNVQSKLGVGTIVTLLLPRHRVVMAGVIGGPPSGPDQND